LLEKLGFREEGERVISMLKTKLEGLRACKARILLSAERGLVKVEAGE
jgi:hypothetical protein